MFDNRDFIYTIPQTVLEDASLNGTDLRIYMYVRSFMDTTKDAYFGNEWVATRLNIDPLTVSRSISKQVQKGYLQRIEINGQRHLIAGKPVKLVDEGLTKTSRGVDENVKGGVDENVNQLDQSIITSKDINIALLKTKNELESPLNLITKAEVQLIFDRMWEMYPLKKGKQQALKWFIQALGGKSKDVAEKFAMEIYGGLKASIDEHLAKVQLKKQGADLWVPNLPYLITWLNGGRWQDDYQAPEDILMSVKRKSSGLDLSVFESQWKQE